MELQLVAVFQLCLAVISCAGPLFSLPDRFQGTWQGVPFASVVGPWSHNFTFSVTKMTHGDYLLEANLPFDASSEFQHFWSWQRSYLKGSGDDKGTLLHCPGPRNPKLERIALMQAHGIGEREITFCLKKWPGYVDLEHPFPFTTLNCYSTGFLQGCGCFNWTLRLDHSGNQLDYQVSMSGDANSLHSKHVWASLHRIPHVGPENLSFPGEGSHSFNCDYHRRDERQTPLASCPFALQYKHQPQPIMTAPISSSFQHCYVLDEATQLVIEWNLLPGSLHVKISARAPFGDMSYVAIGFRPLGGSSSPKARGLGTGREQRFGMRGADIVLGNDSGLHQYFADSYSGAPQPDASLQLSDASTAYADGRVSLEFVRPLIGGRLHTKFGINASIASNEADMLWAVGKWNQEDMFPNYHGFSRGWREVNWTDPEFDERPLLSLRPYKCIPAVFFP